MKQIDLEPHEYEAQPRADEPIFGPGWPYGVATVLSVLAAGYMTQFSPIAAAIAGIVVFGLAAPILSALVSDRQLQVRPPPPDQKHWQ